MAEERLVPHNHRCNHAGVAHMRSGSVVEIANRQLLLSPRDASSAALLFDCQFDEDPATV